MARYLGRVSGPLLDRIDIQLEVNRETGWLRETQGPPAESTSAIQARVYAARELQLTRQACLNSRLGPAGLAAVADIDRESRELLEQAFARFNLSPRTYHRLLKLGRTIADLAGASGVTREHLAEALTLRRFEIRHPAGG